MTSNNPSFPSQDDVNQVMTAQWAALNLLKYHMERRHRLERRLLEERLQQQIREAEVEKQHAEELIQELTIKFIYKYCEASTLETPVNFRPTYQAKRAVDAFDCGICHETLGVGTRILRLDNQGLKNIKRDYPQLRATGIKGEGLCGHEFCKRCLEKWLKDHLSCPTCRGKVAYYEMVEIVGSDGNNENKDTKDETVGEQKEKEARAGRKRRYVQDPGSPEALKKALPRVAD